MAILHWDGSGWAVLHSRGEGSFGAVWGSGRSDVWVVGGGREPDGDRASLLLHWDGTSWTESYLCNPDGNRFSIGWSAYLSDVWGVSGGTIWATGSCKPGGALQPLGYVAQLDRGSAAWRDTPGFELSSQAPELFRELRTIWSSGASDVWAACNDESAGPRYPVPTMLHFDGTSWTPSTQTITIGISDLGGTTASDVWAVGKAGKRLHYDGTTWTAAP